VSHIAGIGIGGTKPRGVGRASDQAPIGIVLQQGRRQPIDRRRISLRDKFRRGHAQPALLAGNIGRVRIGPEIVVEGPVLRNDDHDVLDRSLRVCAVIVAVTVMSAAGRRAAEHERSSRCA
jgi:hypothetical protein